MSGFPLRAAFIALTVRSGLSQQANVSAQAFIFGSLDTCADTCKLQEYTKEVQTHMTEVGKEWSALVKSSGNYASQVGDLTEKLWTGNFDLTCKFQEPLQCVGNTQECWVTSTIADIVSYSFQEFDMSAAADWAKCLRSACPGVKAALGKYFGGVAEAVTSTFTETKAIEDMPEEVQKAVLEGMCPMFGALSCFAAQPKCADLKDAIEKGENYFQKWGPAWLVTEAEKTKASCTAAGVSMQLASVNGGGDSFSVSSGASSTNGVVTFGLLLAYFVHGSISHFV